MNDADRRALDILAAIIVSCRAIESYVDGYPATDRLVHDAVRMRLVDISAAVRTLPADLLTADAAVPWARLQSIGDRMVDGSPDAAPTVVRRTALHEVPRLRAAASQLQIRVRRGLRPAGPGRPGAPRGLR